MRISFLNASPMIFIFVEWLIWFSLNVSGICKQFKICVVSLKYYIVGLGALLSVLASRPGITQFCEIHIIIFPDCMLLCLIIIKFIGDSSYFTDILKKVILSIHHPNNTFKIFIISDSKPNKYNYVRFMDQ